MGQGVLVARQGERLRILVIDDEAGVRAFVCELLESLGYEADGAEDGATGLALLSRRRYDLIITDLRMPNMSGWDVVEAVRQSVPTMPFIVISGFLTDDDVKRAAPAGVWLLHKPFQLADMKRAIRQTISRQGNARPPEPGSCLVCHGPLSSGGGLLYQGAHLVHALCWRDVPAKPLAKATEPESGPDPRREEGRSA
jgi:DNA-binding response OmpR family regulator